MGRTAPAVGPSQHLLATAEGLGRDGGALPALASVLSPAERPAETTRGGVLCRWPLHACETRGANVGKTKRGQGTKWMGLGDGAGPPLGASLEAASPAEGTRLDRTLDTVAVGRPGTPGRPRKRPARLIAATGDGGSSSAPSCGWASSAAWSSAMNV